MPDVEKVLLLTRSLPGKRCPNQKILQVSNKNLTWGGQPKNNRKATLNKNGQRTLGGDCLHEAARTKEDRLSGKKGECKDRGQ